MNNHALGLIVNMVLERMKKITLSAVSFSPLSNASTTFVFPIKGAPGYRQTSQGLPAHCQTPARPPRTSPNPNEGPALSPKPSEGTCILAEAQRWHLHPH